MSARRSRAAAAFGAGETRALERGPYEGPPPSTGGNWAKSAFDTLEARITELRAEHVQAVLDGTLPIRIPAESILDPLGSDRLVPDTDEDDPSDFTALVENIRTRGLRTPIRVRPEDPSWRPDPNNPRNVADARFVLQSGRRRLAACRKLNLDPLAFLSVVPADEARLHDLTERFFENAARKNLRPYEKLLSVGMIAAEYGDTPQRQIATLIGVSEATVSRGVALYQHREALEGRLDPATAGLREINTVLAELRAGLASTSPEAVRKRESRARARAAAQIFATRRFGRTELRARADKDGGYAVTLRSPDLDEAKLQRLAEFVEKLVSSKA